MKKWQPGGDGSPADMGLAFQIQDDILDVTSTTEVLGKPVHSDEKNHKTTYVTLEGLDKAPEKMWRTISGRAMEAAGNASREKYEFLEELIAYADPREKNKRGLWHACWKKSIRSNDIKKLKQEELEELAAGDPAVSDREDQRDRGTSGLQSGRGGADHGAASGL